MDAVDQLLKRIEGLEVAMHAVGGTLRLLSHVPDVGEDMAETLHMLASVLEQVIDDVDNAG